MPSITFTTRGALQKSALRKANERLVLAAVRQNPLISRTELGRMTGLAPSSISFIVNRLIQAAMLVEEPSKNHTQLGRRPTALRVAAHAMMAIGVEISASESRVALADLAGHILQQKRIPWHASHEILVQRIDAAILAILRQHGPKPILGVGVACPGTVDSTAGKVIAAENLNWFNVDLHSMLRARLAVPIYYENAARLSALAERWFAEPGRKPLQNFIFVTPRGGLGTGIVADGHLLRGASGMAGEFGHISLYPDGQRCPCGNQGCWEQYASDKALRRLYAEHAEKSLEGQVAPDAGAIVRMARRGDPVARRVLKQVACDLGLGFVNLIFVFNPEAVIVGDFIAEAWDIVEETVWQVVRSRAPQYALAGLRIFPSQHAADSSLLGAVSLVFSHFFTRFEHGEETAQPGSVLMHTRN